MRRRTHVQTGRPSSSTRILTAAALILSGCAGDGDDPACDAVDCSGHGACHGLDGTAVCACEAGYVAAGTACVADPCAGVTCIHGACLVAAEAAESSASAGTCRCDAGYAGEACDTCDVGFHPEGLGCAPNLPCGDTPCVHGRCAGIGATPICTCDPGYAGDACDACAAGFHAVGLACRANSACDPDPCIHGVCSEVGGEPVCSCETGYTGAACGVCAAGYVPEGLFCALDVAGICTPNPCTTAHRTLCEPQGDAHLCRCDPGYQEELGSCVPSTGGCEPNPCTAAHRTLCVPQGSGYRCDCDAGWQDSDGDGACAPDCDTATLSCGGDAHCEILLGAASCVCDPGFQDNDQDGSCNPTCSSAGLACGGDEICSDQSGVATCVSGQSPPIYISFHWHLHQPIYWPYESVNDTEASGAMGYSVHAIHFDRTGPYTSWPRDAVDAGRSLAHLGAQVSISGSLMENLNAMAAAGVGFQSWAAPWSEAAGWLTTNGNPRLDLVNFGYHHPLMGLIDPFDIRLQLQAHRAMLARNVPHQPSKGIFPPECAFSERLIPALVAEGIEWSLVDNVHFDRAHVDYPYRPESNLPRPNPADQTETAATHWVQLTGLWAPSPVSAPWGYQPHWVEHVDPETGAATRLIAVPAARYEGNEDGRGGFGALQYEAVFSQLEASNTDPLHPMLIVLHHDGDNYGGGTDAYYHANFQAFVSWVAGQPDRFVATTIQDYLDQFPPDPADVIHVEDGSWSGADNGDPEFHKWNGDPAADGYSPDRHSWAVITAVKNRVLTAEAIEPHTSATAIVDAPTEPSANDTDRAWHYLLNAETSCYWYWDNASGGVWDSHPARAANQAAVFADAVLASGGDSVGPTIYLPQREPFNPGLNDAPRDFEVWTLVDDLSSLADVTLHWRVDADGLRDGANELYAGGSWSSASMQSSPVESRTSPAPTYKADAFSATISGLSDQLVDYYVSATDGLGNASRSALMHVHVGSGGNTPTDLWSPAAPTASDVITIAWGQPSSLHWGVDGWTAPPAEYWPSGSFLWSDGLAIESPLIGPDGNGFYSLELGPFDQTTVTEINFVFHNADGTWSSPDHTIPITP